MPVSGNNKMTAKRGGKTFMKILFYDTQNYDRESFDRTKEQFPEIEVEYLKTGLAARTASLAKGYDAVCAFVNSDVGTKTVA